MSQARTVEEIAARIFARAAGSTAAYLRDNPRAVIRAIAAELAELTSPPLLMVARPTDKERADFEKRLAVLAGEPTVIIPMEPCTQEQADRIAQALINAGAEMKELDRRLREVEAAVRSHPGRTA